MHGACMVEGVPAIRKGGEYMFGQDAIFREVIGIYPDARSGFRKEVMSYIDLMAPKKPQATRSTSASRTVSLTSRHLS